MSTMLERVSLPTRRNSVVGLAALAATALAASPASAYIGPGAGISMLGALWAVIAGIVLAIAGLLIWPIRALLRRRKGPAETASTSPMTGSAEAPRSGSTPS
jgi:membrane protein implicated in regulation of membrane protease activity